jgi:hypothetical protein
MLIAIKIDIPPPLYTQVEIHMTFALKHINFFCKNMHCLLIFLQFLFCKSINILQRHWLHVSIHVLVTNHKLGIVKSNNALVIFSFSAPY